MRQTFPVAAVVLALVAGMTAPAVGEEADRTPTLTVTPATDLVDGQTVLVQGDGWRPGHQLWLQQCEVGTDRCALQWVLVDIDASGHFAVERVAQVSFVSDDGDGEVDCLLTTCAFRIDHAVVVEAPIAFDPAAPRRPPPTITITPSERLVDGQSFTVRGEHFMPGDGVDFAECAPGANHSLYDDCHELANGSDLAQARNGLSGTPPVEVDAMRPRVGYATRRVGADGAFTNRLWAYANAYTTPRRRDCRVLPCELVAAVRSVVVARTPMVFDPTAPLRGPPSIRVNPAESLLHHQVVAVRGAGFYGREPMSLRQCVARVDICYSWTFVPPDVDAAGGFSTRIRVTRTVRLSNGARADCRVVRCTLRVSRYRFAGRPHQVDVPITFAG